jgi:hypothetical protein
MTAQAGKALARKAPEPGITFHETHVHARTHDYPLENAISRPFTY